MSNWPASTPTLKQSGNTSVPGMSGFFPVIAPNKRGEMAMVVGTGNSATSPELRIIGRKANDHAGVMGSPTLVKSSETGADGRWGDYFDMTVDPNNDIRFWYVGEYAMDYGWQTYVGSAVITCVEDINADGNVNINDLLSVLAGWGTSANGAEIAEPYDVIDVADILAVIPALGNCP